MPLLEAGPFHAARGDGRTLYSDAVVRLEPAVLTVLEGPSGAGKSTLLRQVAGLGAAPGARRTLAGCAPEGRLPWWRARVTLMAQDAPMLGGTVEENLRFAFAQRAAEGRRWDPDAARELCARVGLEHLEAARPVASLSGGERHRLALVRALLWDPPVLLGDEPLAGLDEPTAAACLELLQAWAHRSGHAALLVLHDLRLAAGADRRLRLEGGRLEG